MLRHIKRMPWGLNLNGHSQFSTSSNTELKRDVDNLTRECSRYKVMV
jgi:hypothetical protein